jgi:ubiquinone/menaquinone biosynthesis C-methylase UbiE
MGQLPDASSGSAVDAGAMTTPVQTFSIPLEAAEAYEATFVPNMFARWPAHLLDLANVHAGDRVLDVACGTGIVARNAADRVGPDGSVTGIDLNEDMLIVARRVRPDLTWQQGDAAALPFADGSFDAVLCQMALMFFPDRVRALREMARVAAPSGAVAVCLPAALPEQPAEGPLMGVATRYAGPEARQLLDTYYSGGNLADVEELFHSAGLRVTGARTATEPMSFESVDAYLSAEVESSPLRDLIDDATYDKIRAGAEEVLAPYVTSTGVDVPLVGYVVAAGPDLAAELPERRSRRA